MKHQLTQEDRIKGNQIRWNNHKYTFVNCFVCRKKFRTFLSKIKIGKGIYCSHECANGKPRSMKKQFKSNGYIYIKNWDHPNRTKQNLVAEHRLIVEKAINRYLTKQEIVHHIDENKHNNIPSNLYLCGNRLEHKVAHQLEPESLKMLTIARYSEWESFKDFNLLRGIQDQLQEMLLTSKEGWIAMSFVWWLYDAVGHSSKGYYGQFISMEQLCLAFVMKEKFNKVWDNNWKSA